MNMSISANANEALPIEIYRNQLEKFCVEHQVAKLSLFGSILRDDFTEESDIDFLVEFEKGYIPTFLAMAQMEEKL